VSPPSIRQAIHSLSQDRETEARFGATPVPGKIGMAMAGQGFNAQPPPRPPHHNAWGGGAGGAAATGNPGNQLYVGNVSSPTLTQLLCALTTL